MPEKCTFEYDDDLDMTFTDCGFDYDGDATMRYTYCPVCGCEVIIGIVVLDLTLKEKNDARADK